MDPGGNQTEERISVFTIANSIGKRPQEKDGQFVSDKEDKKVHGYGLKSIRRIVKKYGGSFQCDVVEEEVKIARIFFFQQVEERTGENL